MKILYVDDDESLGRAVSASLAPRFEVVTVASGEAALESLRREPFGVVVTDLRLSSEPARGMDGLGLCSAIFDRYPELPVILVTGFGTMDAAIGAIRAGAYDFLTKPFEPRSLALAIERASQLHALRQEVRRLRDVVDRATSAPLDLIGTSPAMRPVVERISRVADSDVTVLVTGESGTGKELVARALHCNGRRATGPFVAINCSAVPEALLESELFGHVRGAFTDARSPNPGLFVEAGEGTLFLDEIGDLPLALQPKLLRALQERTVRPVGGTMEIPFQARIVAATNRDLAAAVLAGEFREDLYYRVDVVSIALPPLRARGSDALLLAQHFLRRYAERAGKRVLGFTPTALSVLRDYSWPGNVRELSNAIEHAVALTSHDHVLVEDLPARLRTERVSRPPVVPEEEGILPLEEVERRYVLHAFERLGRNKSLAAQTLGVDRKTLYRKLDKWGYGGS